MMTKRRMVRYLAVAALVVGVLGGRPEPARADSKCPVLCMAKTGSSGHIGEEALWYYAGCLLGCYGAMI